MLIDAAATVIVANPMIPEFNDVAVDDYLDRLHAMTLHHIDLSLLALVEPSRVMLELNGTLHVHPKTLEEMINAGHVTVIDNRRSYAGPGVLPL
jgi:hypothetical protein